jgi:hypothetical protein
MSLGLRTFGIICSTDRSKEGLNLSPIILVKADVMLPPKFIEKTAPQTDEIAFPFPCTLVFSEMLVSKFRKVHPPGFGKFVTTE